LSNFMKVKPLLFFTAIIETVDPMFFSQSSASKIIS
jgi:hypothetical protein